MILQDVIRAIKTVDEEILDRGKRYKDKQMTRSLKIDEMQNVREILVIVQKKMEPKDQDVFG